MESYEASKKQQEAWPKTCEEGEFVEGLSGEILGGQLGVSGGQGVVNPGTPLPVTQPGIRVHQCV